MPFADGASRLPSRLQIEGVRLNGSFAVAFGNVNVRSS